MGWKWRQLSHIASTVNKPYEPSAITHIELE